MFYNRSKTQNESIISPRKYKCVSKSRLVLVVCLKKKSGQGGGCGGKKEGRRGIFLSFLPIYLDAPLPQKS